MKQDKNNEDISDKKSLSKHIQEFEEKLENEKWRINILQAIKSAVEEVPLRGVEQNLRENLGFYLDKDTNITLILNLLANNNPNINELFNIEVPPKTSKFLKEAVTRYGTRVRNALRLLHVPHQWRFVGSEKLSGGSYSSPQLKTTILRWDGNTFVITSIPSDVITLANHLVNNLGNKFDKFGEREAGRIVDKLGKLQDNIKVLEDKATLSIRDSE